MDRFYDLSKWTMKVVKTGDTLKIGKRTLRFIETPMLHWPDSMFTYVEEDRILFTQDAFGQHIASAARFDDEFVADFSEVELHDSVVDYYANILMPFGAMIIHIWHQVTILWRSVSSYISRPRRLTSGC